MSRHLGEAPPKALSEPSPEDAAEDFLKRLPASSRLLVALSGGGDSTGLLAALSTASRAFPGISLHSATVDHGLRSGSAEEAEAARLMSRKLGVPNATLKWIGEKPVTGIQAAARSVRYALLVAEAERINADFIVTGHNRDDQAETIFMRGLRNAASGAGMSEAVLADRRVWVLRPFLGVGRACIRDYLRMRRLTWSEDPSNDNPVFERVRIRQSGLASGNASRSGDMAGTAGQVPNPYLLSAQFTRDHVKVNPGPVAVVDLRECHIRHAPHWHAVSTLAAVIGGRHHGPAADGQAVIAEKLAGSADFRLTTNRVLFDRRGKTLYLYREDRGLPEIEIAPRISAYWDDRYEVTNRGSSPVILGAGRAVTSLPSLLPLEPNDDLPKDVVRRVAASAPRIVSGDAASLAVRPVLAPFDRFLSKEKLDLANALATAFELEQFPSLTLGAGAF